MTAELSKEKVDHVHITLINLWRSRLGVSFGRLSAGLSGAEDVGEELHDHCLRRRDNIFGSVLALVMIQLYRHLALTRTL